MDDKRLDEILDDAVRTYRAPPEAPLDAIWSRVEAEAFATKPAARTPGWRTFAGAIAATLVLGVFAGRMSVARDISLPAAPAAVQTPARLASTQPSGPYQSTTKEFLGRTALLLNTLKSQGPKGLEDPKLTEQARQLLSTTRLLLDSPVAHEQRMRDLLEDLELVFAQVARLHTLRPGEALTLINEALEERDVVPRVRSAAADLSISDY